MKKVTQIMLAVSVALGTAASYTPTMAAEKTSTPATQSDYASHPLKSNIEYVLKNHLMWTFPDGNFRPEQAITQADLVVGLVAVKGLKQGIAVTEIPVNHWARSAYERAKKDGVLTGVAISPSKVISREEVATLMINAWESIDRTRTYKNSDIYKGWSEAQFAGMEEWLPNKPGKYPNGTPTTNHDAFGNVTRAEMSVALNKMHSELQDIAAATSLMERIHKSLKVTNGKVTGTIPFSDKYKVRAIVENKDGKIIESTKGSFSFVISNAKFMHINIVHKGEGLSLSSYLYAKLPSLERKNVR